VRAGKLDLGESLRSSFLLCQSGEFGFVLFSLADGHNLIPDGLLEPLISVIVLSMAITPGMIIVSEKLAKMVASPEQMNDACQPTEEEHAVIIAGYGRVGQTIGKMLDLLERKWVAVDLNVTKINNGRAEGKKVYYGDIAQEKVLHAIGAPKAKLIILTVDNVQATEKSIRAIRLHYPNLPIVVRAHDLEIADKFKALGATYVVPEVVESSIRLGLSATEAMGVDGKEMRAMLDELRADDYAQMKEMLEK
jgi:voltage-gated potassium channel Kch